MTRKNEWGKGDVLIAILKNKSDYAILQGQGWYRIQVKNKTRRLPSRWLAFYQSKVFGDDAYRIRYYGEVRDIQIAKRNELFAYQVPNPKSEQEYFSVALKDLSERNIPIISTRPRWLVFIPTSW